MNANLYSLQLERHFLGGILKHPEVFADVDCFINERDFVNTVHSTTFLVIKRMILNGEKPDKVIVAQKIKDLGIKFQDDIDIFTYVENLGFSQITPEGVKKTAQDLISLRIRRDIVENVKEVERYILDNPDVPVSEIITGADSIFNKQINQFTVGENPVDLFADIDEIIDKRAEQPMDEVGLVTPYPEFNKQFGGLRSRNGIYCVVSRAKAGKSSWLKDMALGVAKCNPDTKVLICDTEMTKDVSQFRIAAGLSGVGYWFYESGNWARNKELLNKREAFRGKGDQFKGKIYHIKVPGRSIQDICSIARKWYYNVVGRGNKAVIILDYIKMANERLSEFYKEYQAIGDKINGLNDLGDQLDVPVWAAMQLNRGGAGKLAADDETAISMSDRLSWFAAWVGIFRKKRVEEIQEDGVQFGSHKLITLVSRFQGKDGCGTHDLVKVDDGNGNITYKENFINYEVVDFNVIEKGTLRDIINHHNLNAKIADHTHNQNDGHINL